MRDPRKFYIEQLADEPGREQVLDELVPLLEAGLSPSQTLDYWAVGIPRRRTVRSRRQRGPRFGT